MKQLVQQLDSGTLRVVDVPAPMLRPGGVLVRTRYSVISAGTERTRVELGRKSLVGKALERPDQVRQVLDTVAREGVANTYRKVRGRLAALSPLGYSSAGIIEAIGPGVDDLEVGQAVACAGSGYANHAEQAWVPRNLVAPVPDGAALEAAAFATLGAIALQGVRQADVRLGESAVVIGLGILGQLTLQILHAAGVRPIGVDLAAERVALARAHGAGAVLRGDDVPGQVRTATGGLGADAVIISAASSSDDPIRLAGEVARDRGRVVVVGAVPIRVPRSPYYEKELDVRLSRSYGPGRYDAEYEEKGHDYPAGYVRWTEGRNLGEFLRLLGSGAVRVDELITHRFAFADAEQAYDAVTGADARALGVVLEYPTAVAPEPARLWLDGAEAPADVPEEATSESNPASASESNPGRASEATPAPTTRRKRSQRQSVGVGVVGTGNFATGVLLPLLERLDVELQGVVSAGGTSARGAAERHGFRYMADRADELFADPAIDLVLIATRHADHAELAAGALRAGKAVFVEKPLAIDERSLEDVLAAARTGGPLMVGFNRRFAPATRFVRERLAEAAGASVVHVRANGGWIDPGSWMHDPLAGGGRLVGEGCHFIDLALHLAGSPPVEVQAIGLGGEDPAAALRDNVQVTLRCADGSLASVVYTAKGNVRSGKERVEIFAGGTTGIIDDFRRAEFWGRRRERWKGRQDKGHAAELRALVAAVREGAPAPIPLIELEQSSRATLRAARSLERRTAESLA